MRVARERETGPASTTGKLPRFCSAGASGPRPSPDSNTRPRCDVNAKSLTWGPPVLANGQIKLPCAEWPAGRVFSGWLLQLYVNEANDDDHDGHCLALKLTTLLTGGPTRDCHDSSMSNIQTARPVCPF